jgi:hypothetical protein
MTKCIESALMLHVHVDVETYFRDGMWYTRRGDIRRPFASGASRQRLIEIGVEVARWNGFRHIIRDADGTIIEVNTYDTGQDVSPAFR